MAHWSVDIVRQSGWDLWVLVCVFASLVLMVYAIAGFGKAKAELRHQF
jgi:hypothetical protein